MSNKKAFKCSLCRKRFRSEDGGQHHLRDFHPKRTDGQIVPVAAMRGDDDGYMSEAEYLIEQQWNF